MSSDARGRRCSPVSGRRGNRRSDGSPLRAILGRRIQSAPGAAHPWSCGSMVNILPSSKGLKLGAMSGASYFFPTCAVLISVCCAIFEWDTIPVGTFDKAGLPILLANGCTAFALNIATVYLIKNTSSLVLTLGGIIKDILLIAISTIVFPESHVTPTQMFGYSIALFGLQVGTCVVEICMEVCAVRPAGAVL